MRLLPDLVDYIAANTDLVVAKTLFEDSMPEDVKQGVVIMPPMMGEMINSDMPDYRKTKFQIVIRSGKRTDGKTLTSEVVDVLTLNQSSVGPHLVKYMRPIHEPIVFPLSEGNMLEISVNFEVCYIAG